MDNRTGVSVDVISDVVCPWCFVGQKRLDRALEMVDGVEVDVRWRPYQLDPSIPPGGLERKSYMLAKFGSEDRLRQMHTSLKETGAQEGIAFALDAIEVSPNTLDAHRVLRWAGSAGPGVQDRLARRLFELYFQEGQNIGDASVLIDAAREAGMDTAVVETLLPTDADREAVQEEIATAARMGVRGVPCFLIEGKYAVMGAQDPGVLADAIRQVAELKARGELEAAS
ncbi:DsbA family oxidoreductase [Aquibium oceanicum]|uniref:Disulfide bond formation protein DsbA n=1 Tax=Aquibium oceanicum TaxID=1670800 RepID=A0A1L3SS39_9HYPH|nr:DsbA family protein [Aquibium oceanicum]APH72228.1 disulfide bond formation protein DsbA [Aquibium oceanicum]